MMNSCVVFFFPGVSLLNATMLVTLRDLNLELKLIIEPCEAIACVSFDDAHQVLS
jgi:hypothetical protein